MKFGWRICGLTLALGGCASTAGPAPQSATHTETPTPSGDSAPDESTASNSTSQVELISPKAAAEPTHTCPCQSKVAERVVDAETPAPPPAPLPEGTKVLHVGDSFAGALGVPLGARLEADHVKSVLKYTDSSYLTDWAWNGDFQNYVWKYNPDLIIITLGANELAIAEPEQRKKTIQKIMSIVGDRPCLWVAIPLWNGKQNGLLDIIRDNAKSCVFFDTNQLMDVEHMARISDGIHPTQAAREQWAEVVFAWLKAHRSPDGPEPWTLRPRVGASGH